MSEEAWTLIRLGDALAFAPSTQALVELVTMLDAMQLDAGRMFVQAAPGHVEDALFCVQVLKQS